MSENRKQPEVYNVI